MWHYPAQIWLSDDSEGWYPVRGELIYTDGEIGRVQTDQGIIEAPVHRIYIYSPLVMFMQTNKPTFSGRYGSDGPFRQTSMSAPQGRSTKVSKRPIGVSDEEEIFG
jgi:hypothetical protein